MKKLTKQAKLKLLIYGCVAVGILLALLYFGFSVRPVNEPKPIPVPEIPERKKAGDPRIYPDPDLTPGDVFENITAKDVCVPGYAERARNVSQAKKKRIYAAYGVPYPQPRGAYEVDHFIALAIGGSNSEKNLWMESREPRPGYKEKDIVENWLHREVCKNRMTLTEAQEAMRTDWYAVYLRIPRK